MLTRLTNVSVDVGGRPVLQNLSWTLQSGEVWALTGPNGAGKSTFLRLVRGDLWPTKGERRYAWDGVETRSPLSARARVALISPEQGDWYARSDWALSAWQVVLSGVTGGALPPHPLLPQHEARARAAVARLGLEELMARDVRRLSTGQRRQVLLARALAGSPEALILDEFWEGVDAASRARLRGLVEALARAGLTVLYSTHRPEEFLSSTTHHLHLQDGRVAESGQLKPPPRLAPRPNAAPTPTFGEVVLEVRDADVYRDDARVLRGVSWQLRAREHWVVVGPNGAGKSTFALLVAGEVHPAVGGFVRRFDLSARATLEERRRAVALVSAEEQARHRRPVAGEVVVASGLFGTVGRAEGLSAAQAARLHDVAARLNVTELLSRTATELSHGQLKKLLFARALVGTPRLLILDEPFDYLDDDFRARLLVELERRAAQGAQFLFAVHRRADLPPFATHALHLEGGRVVRAGRVGELPLHALLA